MRIEERYRLESRLGEGAQSVVYLGSCLSTGALVAVKQIKATDPSLIRADAVPITKLAANFREIAVLQRLRSSGTHPNIVELIEVVFDERSVYIVMEHCGVSLSEFIAQARRASHGGSGLGIGTIREVMQQTLSAMAFVHSQLVLHRDLKPQNIFIAQSASGHIVVKVGDFGLSKAQTVPIAPETLHVASLWYRAPEVLLQSGYDVGIDLWSLGCIIGELATGRPLFVESCEYGLLMKIFQTLGTPTKDQWAVLATANNYSPKWPQWKTIDCLPFFTRVMRSLLGHDGCDLLMALFKYESNARVRCAQALKHSFFRPSGVNDDTCDNYLHPVEHFDLGSLSDRFSDLSV